MIDKKLHAAKCQKLLSSLGEAQNAMLSLETDNAMHKLTEIYDRLGNYITQMELKLSNTDRNHSHYIFWRQLGLMKRFMLEFKDDLPEFLKKNPEQVIRMFERHHLFKKVMLKHISDLTDETK